MSTPIRKPTESQAMAWLKANPDATDEELRAYVGGVPPSPSRFGTSGLLGKAVALGRGAFQTATFGLGDEIVGGIEGAVRPGMSIGEGIAGERAINKEVQQGNKGTYFVGELAGGVGTGLGGAKLALSKGGALANILLRGGSRGILGRTGASAAAGAVGAGATSFGMAEGNPIERAPEMLMGGALGGAVGGVIPLAGALGRGIGNATHIRPAMVDPIKEAATRQNAALAAENLTPAAVYKQARKDPSVPQGMVDVGGDHVRQLAIQAQGGSNSARVTGRKILEDRIEGERDRWTKRLESVLNPKDKDIAKAAKALKDTRSANAAVNFDKVLDNNIDDVDVAKFFRENDVKRAYEEYRKGMAMQARNGVKDADGNPIVAPPEIYTYGVDGAGKNVPRLNTTQIPLRAFHEVQQALNDAIENGFKNGKKIPKHQAESLQKSLAVHMDRVEVELVPEYGRARGVYRDDSSSIDALESGLGNKIKNQHGRQIPNFKDDKAEVIDKYLTERRAAANAGDDVAAADVENYLLGSLGSMRDGLREHHNKTTDYLLKPENRDKVLALFGGDRKKASQFASALRAEKRIKPTSSVDKTGTAIAGEGEVAGNSTLDLLLAGTGVAGGRNVTAIVGLSRLLRGENSMSDATATQMMKDLFKGSGGIEELKDHMRLLNRVRADEIRRRGRNVGVTAGAAAGGSAVVQD